MLPYIFIITFTTVLVFFSGKISNFKKNNRYSTISLFLLSISCIVFVMFSSFRRIEYGYGGRDAITYKNYFLSVNTNFVEALKIQNYEWGYSILVWIGRMITNNYSFFLLFIYSFMFIGVALFLKLGTWNKYYIFTIALMISLLLNSFNINRVILAVTIGLIVYKSLCEKKILRSFLLTILAISIHVSSVILLPCILLVILLKKQVKFNWKINLLLVFLFSMITIGTFKIFFGLIASSKYGIYDQSSSIAWPTYIVIFIVFLLSVAKYKSMIELNSNNEVFIKILPMGLMVAPLQMEFPILYRMLLFFLPIVYILVPSLIKVYQMKRINQFIYPCIQFLLCFYLIIRLYVFFTIEIYSSGIPYSYLFLR